MDPPANKNDLIQQFCALTQANPSDAQSALSSCNWDLETAIQTWFNQQDDTDSDDFDYGAPDDASDDKPQPIPTTTGHNARGAGSSARQSAAAAAAAGAGAASSSSGSASSSGAGTGTGGAGRSLGTGAREGRGPHVPATGSVRTLRDIGSNAQDEDDDDEKDPNYFAGGEKSGLAVQGSGSGSAQDAIQGILDRARRNLPRPGGDDEPSRPSHFTGRGITLGGDDAPSQVVVDDESTSRATPARAERVRRVLHLWQDGFSVDEGDLYRYDDPANRAALDMINSGRAPVHLLNVQPGQEVDLEVSMNKDTKYVRPKAKYKPFSGQGQRLGSPTPGVSTASSSATAAQKSPSNPAAKQSDISKTATVTIDDSQPTVTLQIRLGDGSRLQSRFNVSHTIEDVYSFVDRSQSAQRSYVLMTTFPSKELSDKSALLGDLAEFKRGGVIVQKWI